MSKIRDAEDIFCEAQSYIKCVRLAACKLETSEESNAIAAVAMAAYQKIDEGIALLDECPEVRKINEGRPSGCAATTYRRPRTPVRFPPRRHHGQGERRGAANDKPKDTQAPMSGAFAQALARHMAAQAALDAVPGPEDYPEHLCNEEGEALDELAFTPCASDAEFLEKLRYLYAQQAKIWDLPDNGDDYGCIVIAAACHFCPVNA